MTRASDNQSAQLHDQYHALDSHQALRCLLPSVAYTRVAFYAVILGILLSGVTQSLCAQQQSVAPRRLPSAEKIVESYLKAIGGKKRVANIRDATYEWTIQLNEQTMGLARTLTKTPSSLRSEMRSEEGRVGKECRSRWS